MDIFIGCLFKKWVHTSASSYKATLVQLTLKFAICLAMLPELS